MQIFYCIFVAIVFMASLINLLIWIIFDYMRFRRENNK